MSENTTSKINTSNLRAYIMIAVLALIWAYFHWATDSIFLTPRNLSNLMTQMSVTGILAVGMLMVIVSANIDLAVGSVLGLAGGVAAYSLASWEFSVPVAIAIAVMVSIAIGTFQGVLTAYMNIPAFIVTLGGLLAWRGAVKWQLGGNTVPVAEDSFKFIGQGNLPMTYGWALAGLAIIFVLFMVYRSVQSARSYGLGEVNYAATSLKAIIPIGAIVAFMLVMNSYQGVPIPVLIFVFVALFGAFLTTSTTFGRYLYAIGGNAEAARLSGINNRLNVVKVFALLGALTGIAALIFTARVGSAAPDAGVLKELDAIAACVIGGASLMGGRGTIFGACLGALIMASLDNGMSLLNVRDFMQDIIKGSILVAAVGLDMFGRKQG
ncbi:MAG: sugar ABC transporter permease [Acidobacteria bacterium]|nr:sugar ABC transporter permease [Acidobacteriota bacterium]